MGKPAARLMDMSMHGGMVVGPGCPTVLIGKMPAARMTDMHVCPGRIPDLWPYLLKYVLTGPFYYTIFPIATKQLSDGGGNAR